MAIRYRARNEYREDFEVMTVAGDKGRERVPVKSVDCVVCGRELKKGKPGVFTASEEWVWMDGCKVPLGYPRHEDCGTDQLLRQAVALTMIGAIR